MAFRILTDDPSAREVGDLIIVHDRFAYVDVVGQLGQNSVKKFDGEIEPAVQSNQGEGGGDEEDDDEEEAEDDDIDLNAHDDDQRRDLERNRGASSVQP